MSNDVRISPTEAKAILAVASHKGNADMQRKLNSAHVAYLANQMRQGKFGRNEIQLYHFNGETYLVNGQHTLNAIVKSGVTINLPIFERTVFSKSDIEKAYAQADVGKPRTERDLIEAFGLVEQTGLTAAQLNGLRSAVRYIVESRSKFARSHVKMVSRADWAKAALVAAKYYGQIASELFLPDYNTSVTTALKRRIELAHIILTYSQHHRASEFWTGVASGEMLTTNDPRKRLHDFLMTAKIQGGGAYGETVTHERLQDTIAACWNKFLAGSEMKILSRHSTLNGVDGHTFCLKLPFYEPLLKGIDTAVPSIAELSDDDRRIASLFLAGSTIADIQLAVFGYAGGAGSKRIKGVLESMGIEHGLTPSHEHTK